MKSGGLSDAYKTGKYNEVRIIMYFERIHKKEAPAELLHCFFLFFFSCQMRFHFRNEFLQGGGGVPEGWEGDAQGDFFFRSEGACHDVFLPVLTHELVVDRYAQAGGDHAV